MFIIESFLTTIVSSIIKRAISNVIAPFLDPMFNVYSVYSLYQDAKDCVDAKNDVNQYLISGLHVISSSLADEVIDRFMTIGNETFSVEQTDNGVLIASRLIPEFITSDIRIPIKKEEIRVYDERIQANFRYDESKVFSSPTYDPIFHYSKVLWYGQDEQGWCVYKKDPYTNRVLRIDFYQP